jgi:L-alanine-DL-glutamate epimerase-like enolase superfamily enzyme
LETGLDGRRGGTVSKTTIQLWASIDAAMDDDRANVLGAALCELVMQHLRDQQIPVDVVTAYALHE